MYRNKEINKYKDEFLFIYLFWDLITEIIMFNHLSYHNVVSSNTSHLEAHAGFFRLLMKGILILMYCDLLTKTLFPN